MPSTKKKLSEREIDVVCAIINGCVTSAQIAEHLTIQQRTVRTHLSRIYRKVGATNMVELVLMALGRRPSAAPVGRQVALGLAERGGLDAT